VFCVALIARGAAAEAAGALGGVPTSVGNAATQSAGAASTTAAGVTAAATNSQPSSRPAEGAPVQSSSPSTTSARPDRPAAATTTGPTRAAARASAPVTHIAAQLAPVSRAATLASAPVIHQVTQTAAPVVHEVTGAAAPFTRVAAQLARAAIATTVPVNYFDAAPRLPARVTHLTARTTGPMLASVGQLAPEPEARRALFTVIGPATPASALAGALPSHGQRKGARGSQGNR